MKEVLSWIMKEKIIAIVRNIDREFILDTAQAIYKGGISCLEIALNHSSEAAEQNTYEMIALLKKEYGKDLCIGAGTVLTEEEVNRCAQAGASYIISPNMNCGVIHRTKEMGLVSMPGAITPSEIVQAYEAGADIVKLFPAGVLGADYIRAVRGPLNHIPMSAVGNVTPENCGEFLKAGCCCVGVGSNLTDRKAIQNGNYERITQIAKEYVRNVL